MAETQRIVIIGGVAGGASAATRARRINEDADIILIEKDEYVSFANCGLPYHIGGEIADRGKLLVATAALLRQRFRLDVRTRQEAVSIDRARRVVCVRRLETGEEYDQSYDKLILSPGAAPFVPPVPGQGASGVFTLRNIGDMDRIIAAAAASQTRRAVVVGAGFIGLEMVEQLAELGFRVSLAELNHQVLPLLDREMVVPLQQALQARGVQLALGDGLAAVEQNSEGHVEGVRLSSGLVLDGDFVILGLGVRPCTALAEQAGLEIGATGGIATNEFQQTSDPHIYAVGDACEYLYGPTGEPRRVALAGPANRAGRLAGEHAASGGGMPRAPVFGTSIVRVFELAAGMTGLTVKGAEQLGKEVASVTVVANQHAGYFPGASPVTFKLTYDPVDGRILGAQAVGQSGIDKRLDVIATALAFGGTVETLAGLDLTYAPPFGSAKDVIHMAAFAACNAMTGRERFLPADADLAEYQVVDVRSAAEIQKTPLTGCDHALAIPVDELRERLSELDSRKPTVVSCGVGVRAHVAFSLLSQSGFTDLYNLSGGATVRRRAVPPNEV